MGRKTSDPKKPLASTKKRDRRLRKELLDLLADPVENCSACPLDGLISMWHANIYSPELGVTFHFEITYPPDYPNVAPQVRPLTYISHPNVFGDYICLDILTMSHELAGTPFRGWTTAYTISSLLVQLQCFLFDVQSRRSHEEDRMKREASRYVCKCCPHSRANCYPKIERYQRCTPVEETPNIELTNCPFLEDVPDIVLDCICSMCDHNTITKLRFLYDEERIPEIDRALAKRRFKCFYTLKDLNDDSMILGLGAKKDIMARRSRKTGNKTTQLQRLHCSFDYISREAYKMGVRNNIWKDRDFDSFIPLFINRQHGRLALPFAEKCLLQMWNDSRLTYKAGDNLRPETIMETLSKLMNTTVVNMMKTVEDLESGELQLFDSIKALEGYVSFHHLLLAFVEQYPDIIETARERVQNFIENPMYRDKEVTPDIGELLVCLSITDFTWEDFCPAWLEEAFVRNARWICAKYPNLLTLNEKASCIRMTQSFKATRTGKRLAMFQRFFISEIACPERLRGNPDKCRILLDEYNQRFGLPIAGMAEKLQEHSRKVIACDNWFDYFELINFCAPSAARLDAWLRNSIRISEEKQYHNRRNVLKYTENHLERPTNRLHMDSANCVCCGGSVVRITNKDCAITCKSTLVKAKGNAIDICFVLDCTGSMHQWINNAKKNIRTIIKKVSRDFDGTVRFAMVGYRDHGDAKYVQKGYDFTEDPEKAQKYVDFFTAGGGADYPEAMCCAMDRAYNMQWNREANQMVVLIADAPPHGLGGSKGSLDDYPNGCPCGCDSIRIAHTMAKAGIAIYTVDCGYADDPTRQTFFHALAKITGGYAMNLSDAKTLPKVVCGAALEEKSMNALAEKIKPIYEDCLKTHALGRFEQHCRSVFAQLEHDNVKVKSVLPPESYRPHIKKQIEHIVFCTDMAHAREMANREYFSTIDVQTKLKSGGSSRLVTIDQVTKCMKRMREKMQEAEFRKNGCGYLQAPKFKEKAFKIRWKEYEAARATPYTFRPWHSITDKEMRAHREIPDARRLRNKSKKAKTAAGRKDYGFINAGMMGQTIEIELEGTWSKVQILKPARGNKWVCSQDGFHIKIADTTPWRPFVDDAWAKKPAVAKPTPEKPVAKRAPAKPVAKPAPAKQVAKPANVPASAPRSVPQGKKVEAPVNGIKMGDVVNVRNSSTESWNVATVTQLRPVIKAHIRGEGDARVFQQIAPPMTREFTMLTRVPVYKNIGADLTFDTVSTNCTIRVVEFAGDWAHIVFPLNGWILARKDGVKLVKRKSAPIEAPAAPVVTDSRVEEATRREKEVQPVPSVSEARPAPVVTEARPVPAALEVRPEPAAASESGERELTAPRDNRDRSRSTECPFQINEIVNVRNSNEESWQVATVVKVYPHVTVKLIGDDHVHTFLHVAPAATRTFVTRDEIDVFHCCGGSSTAFANLEIGTGIQVVAFNGSWARIISPCLGWIEAKQKGTKLICKPESFIRESLGNPSGQITLTFRDLPRHIGAASLAKVCQEAGVLPLGIRIYEDRYANYAVVTFDDMKSAILMNRRGLKVDGQKLTILW